MPHLYHIYVVSIFDIIYHIYVGIRRQTTCILAPPFSVLWNNLWLVQKKRNWRLTVDSKIGTFDGFELRNCRKPQVPAWIILIHKHNKKVAKLMLYINYCWNQRNLEYLSGLIASIEFVLGWNLIVYLPDGLFVFLIIINGNAINFISKPI
jgi:hypothetical protein